MDTKTISQELNPEQNNAVLATEGYIRVIAGFGVGKTRVLTERMIYIIQHLGINPENILCVTFTNKAANEMAGRIANVLDYRPENICTFHGFCYRFLQRHINVLNYPDNFLMMDGEYQLRLLKEIYKELDITAHAIPPADMLAYISDLKSKIKYIPSETMRSLDLDMKDIRNSIFEKYLIKQFAEKMLDFDDLLYFTLYLLNRHADLLNYWQNQFRYILVDEFQDVNKAQFDLVTLLQGKHKNLFIVGDPDQTIYSWRGSNIRFINEFDQTFPGTQTFLLKLNYRSTPSIINVCNSLIKNNTNRIENTLVPVNKSDGKVFHYHAKNIYDESHFIAEAIMKLKKNHDATYDDIAILYRSSHITRQVEEALIKFNLPYLIIKGTAFYERQEIKDALAFLRLLTYGDDISFLRIINKPGRGIGAIRLKYIKKYAWQNNLSLMMALTAIVEIVSVQYPRLRTFVNDFYDIKSRMHSMTTSQVLDEILNKTGYEKSLYNDLNSDRIENIQELKQSIRRQEDEAGGRLDVTEYLSSVALYGEITDKQHPNCVKLMSVHAAKGLEFKYVIVCGFNEGKFPSNKVTGKDEMEEERRVAYVAFTRAKDGLIITSSSGLDLKNIPQVPSRFLSEISPGLITEIKRENNYFSLAAKSLNIK